MRLHSGVDGLSPAGMLNPRANAEPDDAEPNAGPNAKPDAELNAKSDTEPNAEPDAEPNVEPDVCTDRLHCVGLGAMVDLQPAVRPRIPEAQSRGSHRCAIWRRLPGGERIVSGPNLHPANLRLHTFAVDGLGNLQ